MCLHFLFKSVFHKLRHKFLSGFVNSFPDYVVPFTHTFADHSSVITKCWGFELQNGKSSLKSPQTLAAQGFAPASFSSMNDNLEDLKSYDFESSFLLLRTFEVFSKQGIFYVSNGFLTASFVGTMQTARQLLRQSLLAGIVQMAISGYFRRVAAEKDAGRL